MKQQGQYSEFSYWEYKSWLENVDYAIIGSGITGLNCALHLREKDPKAKILILEKGMLPDGASTKNAGFASFGSVSEILDDLQHHSEEQITQLIDKRYRGLQLLRKNLGDKAIGYKNWGGYELFRTQDKFLYESSLEQLARINGLINNVVGKSVFELKKNPFGFKNIQPNVIYNRFESQIDTGKMMRALVKKAHKKDILILNNQEVIGFTSSANSVTIRLKNFNLKAKKLCIAANGFANTLGIEEVKPARAQVLITKPIKGLKIKGTFHLDRGYYYFRNINDRILLGGGRNLDFSGEETITKGISAPIQQALEELLLNTILPDISVEIDQCWSGIMGMGSQKNPIVMQVADHVYCGVRLGGIGIAIGSLIGQDLAELAL